MQQSCTCGSVRGASSQLASLPRPQSFGFWDSLGGHLTICVQLVYKKAVLKGLKMDLSNAESTTDS